MAVDLKLIDDLAQLRGALQYGDKKRIAQQLGIHRNSVDAVLKGEYEDDRVILEALEILKARAEATEARRNKIRQTLDRLNG